MEEEQATSDTPPSGLRALGIVRGWPGATALLREWAARPLPVLGPWIAVSLGIAALLLGLVWLVGVSSPADPSAMNVRHLLEVHDAWRVEAAQLFRNNLLVLALHAMACLAGFLVHLALTDPTDDAHSMDVRLSRSLAVVAVAFVPVATLLSIATQAWVLGSRAATLSDKLHMPVHAILWTTTTHSLPELAAVFLPLAASLVLIARGRPDALLAATVATVVIAVPVIALSAISETQVWPRRLVEARKAYPHLEGQSIGHVVVDPGDRFSAEAMLSAGPQLDDEVYDTEDAAIAAAKRIARPRRPAIVVLSVRDGFVIHELHAMRQPHVCDRLNGMRLVQRPISFEDLQPLKREPSSRFLPNVEAFVGAGGVLQATDLEPPPVEPTFKRQC